MVFVVDGKGALQVSRKFKLQSQGFQLRRCIAGCIVIDSKYGPLIWALTLFFLVYVASKYGPLLVYGI